MAIIAIVVDRRTKIVYGRTIGDEYYVTDRFAFVSLFVIGEITINLQCKRFYTNKNRTRQIGVSSEHHHGVSVKNSAGCSQRPANHLARYSRCSKVVPP